MKEIATLVRIFWTPFFDQFKVPKKVTFYPKLTIFVGFSVFFVIIIIKITKILIKIIMATIIIIISIFSIIRAKRRFCQQGKVGKVARIPLVLARYEDGNHFFGQS